MSGTNMGHMSFPGFCPWSGGNDNILNIYTQIHIWVVVKIRVPFGYPRY